MPQRARKQMPRPRYALALFALTIIFLLAIELICSPTVLGQIGFSNLSGSVLDETKAAVAEVEVSLINVDTGFQRSVASDDRGYFIIPFLAPGSYLLSARMPGFATVTIRDIRIHSGIDVALSIVLKPKGVTESIDIIANGEAGVGNSDIGLLDVSNPATKYSVTNREVMSLPVFANELGRNPLNSLPFIIPGVSPVPGSSVLPGVNVQGSAVHGSRASSISFNVDGAGDDDDEVNQTLSSLPNPDALEEFTFITSNYQADLGRSAGGAINAVVKSGTAHLRGNARYLAINEGLNARSFFDPRVPRFRLNNFGGQLGGPGSFAHIRALQDRLTFFADYEGTRSSKESTSNFAVPSVNERQGDFSAFDAADRPIDPRTGQLFPGARIPANRVSPIALAYLTRFIPTPNIGGNRFVQLLPVDFGNDQGTARLDYVASSKDSFNLIFLSSFSRLQQSSGNLPVSSRQFANADSYKVILRHTRTISESSVNQITGTITGYRYDNRSISPGLSGHDPAELGFVGIHPQSGASLSLPVVDISDANVLVADTPGLSSAKTLLQARDDFSRSAGKHSFKFGGEGKWYSQQTIEGGNDGLFEFSGFLADFGTGNSFADFLLGIPAAYFQATGYSAYPRQKALALYALDDLHVSSDLTVNLGLRYELTPPTVDKYDHVSTFRPGQHSSVFPNAPAGLLFVGDSDPVLGHIPRGLYPADYRNFAPRIGLAFVPRSLPGVMRSLFGERKTSLRTGWGIFYDHAPISDWTRMATGQPFSFTQVLTNFDQTGGSFAAPFGNGPNPWPIAITKRPFTFVPSIVSVDPSFRTPYTYHYDIVLQRELTPTTTLEVSYIGSNSFRTLRDRQLNLTRVGPGANQSNEFSRKMFPAFGNIVSAESSGRARSDSLQVQTRRSFSHGLLFTVSYVWSRSLDNGAGLKFSADSTSIGTQFVGNVNTNSYLWGRSPYDRTHNFVLTYSYDLPECKLRYLRRPLSGLRVSGITELRSGLPLDIFQYGDTTLTAADLLGNGLPDLVGSFRSVDPRHVRSFYVNGAFQTGNYFFDPSAFRKVTVSDFTQARQGNLTPGKFDGPGFNLTSISIEKTWRIAGSQQIAVRSDIKNLFNHANFDTVDVRVGGNNLGQVYSAAPGRTVQLSARYTF